MKCKMTPTGVAIVFAVVVIVSVTATAEAGDAACSAARAAGTYGVSDSGTVVGIGPRAAVALLTLDAAGNIKGKVTASLNGSVTNGTLSGTFTVNPDCTGLLTSTDGGDNFGFVIVGGGAEILATDLSGSPLSLDLKKQ